MGEISCCILYGYIHPYYDRLIFQGSGFDSLHGLRSGCGWLEVVLPRKGRKEDRQNDTAASDLLIRRSPFRLAMPMPRLSEALFVLLLYLFMPYGFWSVEFRGVLFITVDARCTCETYYDVGIGVLVSNLGTCTYR